jgi:hypothetical protein
LVALAVKAVLLVPWHTLVVPAGVETVPNAPEMTRAVFVLVAGQAPVAGMEYVMVYEPALLADTSTKPEVLLIESPGAE